LSRAKVAAARTASITSTLVFDILARSSAPMLGRRSSSTLPDARRPHTASDFRARLVSVSCSHA
jgi:hypothetical protein